MGGLLAGETQKGFGIGPDSVLQGFDVGLVLKDGFHNRNSNGFVFGFRLLGS
jgi:hypothetical protein